MTKKEEMELIKMAKSDVESLNAFIGYVRDVYMNKRIYMYIERNRLVDADDIRQEFLVGVMKAVQKVKLDVGDPIEFIIWSGKNAIKEMMRRDIRKGVVQICMDCGNVSKINKEGNMYKCRACGSFNIETKDKDYYNDIEIHAIVDEEELIEDQVATEDYLKSFEITIDMNTNVGKIYIELINGARDKYRNYTKEIAEKWGTSQTNVMHAVKKLQKKFNNFREE